MEHPHKDETVSETGARSAKRARLMTQIIAKKVACCPRLGMGERVQVSELFENKKVYLVLSSPYI